MEGRHACDSAQNDDDDWVFVNDDDASRRLSYDVMDSAHCPWCLCDRHSWMRPFMKTWYAAFPVAWTLEQTDAWMMAHFSMRPSALPVTSLHDAERAAADFSVRARAEWERTTANFEFGPAEAIRHRRSFHEHTTPDMWRRHRIQHVYILKQ